MDRQRNPAVKWGLIFGGLLILLALINLGIEIATGALNAAASSNPLGSMNFGASLAQSCVVFLIEVALYFVAGLLTARENGRVGSAAVAGVIAGALAGVVGAIIAGVTMSMRLSTALPPESGLSPAQTQVFTTIILILGVVFGLAFAIGIGAGLAALGGLVGRGQFEAAHPAPLMTESYYAPMAPPPGYPVHPQGAYPPAPGAMPGAMPPVEQPSGYPPQYPPQYPSAPGQYPPPPPYPPQYPPQQQ
ncbi:MAG TPA: hypothetical protein VFX31_10385 [Ktedonobacterales bacterium]|jgi:hypothetical protein|nr:hypothetical protein [Ktedonobacterales bacterium]HEX5571787.1 hypothetical protein [Ktedonobacterales bacterium]